MGRKSGVTVGGYHPRIFAMHWAMAQRELLAGRMETIMNKKKMRSMYWTQRLSNAMGLLRASDPANWEAWFDDDVNVPADANDQQMAMIIEARVRTLIGYYPTLKAQAFRGIFIWTDEFNGVYVYSKEVGKKALYAMEFTNLAEAEAFVRGLPIDNCGYGVVLDILPADAMANIERVES